MIKLFYGGYDIGIVFIRLSFISRGLAVFFLILTMIATSCASSYVKVHSEPINIQSLLKKGDTVRIVAKDKREIEFVVVEVSDEAIIGENEKVLFTDIFILEEMSVSAGENAGIIIGTTAGAAAGIFLFYVGGSIQAIPSD